MKERIKKKNKERKKKKEKRREGWCLFSRCAMQMRLCILDPVRWIYCLHLLLPEEREGKKGERGRDKDSTYSPQPSGYTLLFKKKKKIIYIYNRWDERRMADRQMERHIVR